MKIGIQDGDSLQSSEEEDMEEFGLDTSPEGEEEKGEALPGGLPNEGEKLTKKELPRKKSGETARLKEMVKNLTEELKKREAELIDAEDRALRAVAEVENFKKRVRREREEESRFANAAIIEELLPIMDNFDKAILAAKEDETAPQGLVEGVEMIRRQIMDLLERRGLEKLKTSGELFNPETMEAIHMLESGEHADGAVVEEYIPGYKFKDRVLRPAKVQVARNPEKSGE